MTPFSLYLHIPYCQAKCPYCDFNSYAATQWPEERYTAALIRELEHYAATPDFRSRSLQTVFFGGGTPSLFAADSIRRVLEQIRHWWPLSDDVEITLEANPGTVAADRLAGMRAAGINRVSFGVQSFWPHHLQTLGRIHSSEEAVDAIRTARKVGFERRNLDLIYALPNQTLEEWAADLTRACELRPEHISAYNLTYEEGTAFHEWRSQGRLRQQAEEIELAMFEMTQRHLSDAGYQQYEISNYSRPGEQSRHNLNYWRAGDYLGVGAGAHSFAQRSDSAGSGRRWSNVKAPTLYLDKVEGGGAAVAAHEEIAPPQARGEFVFLNLRCLDGFAEEAFRARFNVSFVEAFPHATTLKDDGLLDHEGGQWRLSARGLVLADTVFATFV